MSPHISDILARIEQLEEELEAEFKRRRLALEVDFEHRRVHFEEAVLEQHRRLKTGLAAYLMGAELRHVFSAPPGLCPCGSDAGTGCGAHALPVGVLWAVPHPACTQERLLGL